MALTIFSDFHEINTVSELSKAGTSRKTDENERLPEDIDLGLAPQDVDIQQVVSQPNLSHDIYSYHLAEGVFTLQRVLRLCVLGIVTRTCWESYI